MDVAPEGTQIPSTKHSSSYDEAIKQQLAGIRLHFPGFQHEKHPPRIDVNATVQENMTMGQKIADMVASGMGSWRFIIIQTILLVLWIVLNLVDVVAWMHHWDPYPFIFLNLALSFQAAYSAPIIMMSQNRQSQKDRLTAENDYKTDLKGEQEVTHVMSHLDHQDELTREILLRLEKQNLHMEQLDQRILQVVQQLEQQHEGFAEQHQEILKRLQEIESR